MRAADIHGTKTVTVSYAIRGAVFDALPLGRRQNLPKEPLKVPDTFSEVALVLSTLTRISLIGLILYGGYQVFAEQRIIRVCENEVTTLEKSFESRLDPRSTDLEFRCLTDDSLFFSWVYHAPANTSFAIQIQSKESEGVATTTLLRISSQPTGHYGIIDIQFNTDGSLPPLIKQLEIYGPNFLKAEQWSGKDSQYMSPTKLDLVVSKDTDVFQAIQQPRGLFSYSLRLDPLGNSKTHQCRPDLPLALCQFTEEETAGSPLIHRDFIIRAAVDE